MFEKEENEALLFTAIYDIETMMEYDGFIGLEGEYYKVRETGMIFPSHEEWAKRYLEKYYNIREINTTHYNYIVNKMGFIITNHILGTTAFYGEPRNEKQQKTMKRMKNYKKERGNSK